MVTKRAGSPNSVLLESKSQGLLEAKEEVYITQNFNWTWRQKPVLAEGLITKAITREEKAVMVTGCRFSRIVLGISVTCPSSNVHSSIW